MDFTGYQDLYQNYERQEKISFDYAVVERESDIQVLRYTEDWKDVGTYEKRAEEVRYRICAKKLPLI